MKKGMKNLFVLVGVLLIAVLTGCSDADNSFSSVTKNKLFENVPIMSGENVEFSEVEDIGGENFMITAHNTNLNEYEKYLSVLEKEGFSKHVDNGTEGIEGYVYTSHYMKKDLLVIVSHLTKMGETTIIATKNSELSEHLIYSDAYKASEIEGKKTTFAMPELYTAGNSFIIQLKNGHFIINDGGMEDDLPYLLDYLDSLAPNGEKPVVDAWIISHAHTDHMGVFLEFYDKEKYADRLYVEEVFFTEPSAEAQVGDAAQYDQADTLCFYTQTVPSLLKRTDGTTPQVYRMRVGERYFFNDITMDVIFSPDILPFTEWKTWNATSVVLMYTIEGQKVMIDADMDWECQKVLLETFDDEYFEMDIYQAPHHGGNVYNEFSSHITTNTVLYPSFDVERGKTALLGRYVQNTYLKSIALEALGWGDGGVVLTFPYKVGTYEKLPLTDWIYHINGPTNR